MTLYTFKFSLLKQILLNWIWIWNLLFNKTSILYELSILYNTPLISIRSNAVDALKQLKGQSNGSQKVRFYVFPCLNADVR